MKKTEGVYQYLLFELKPHSFNKKCKYYSYHNYYIQTIITNYLKAQKLIRLINNKKRFSILATIYYPLMNTTSILCNKKEYSYMTHDELNVNLKYTLGVIL